MNYNRLSVLLLCIFLKANLFAQMIERTFSAGFQSSIDLIKPYDNDRWLLAGSGEPEPGAYFQDTLFVAILGADGNVFFRKNLSMPGAEVHYWHDILALPDGGILASFESTLCDVGADMITIQCLDASGNLRWQINGGFVLGSTRPPEHWFVAPDSHLLGMSFDQVWKINPANGEILFKAALQGVSSGLASPHEMINIPGTEDFIAVGNPDFQYWTKSGPPDDPIYVLSNELDFDGYRKHLSLGADGRYYCVKYFPDVQFERVNLAFQHETLPIPVEAENYPAYIVGDSGIYAFNAGFFTRYNFQGGDPQLIPATESWIQKKHFSAAGGRIAICGSDLSGWPYHPVPPTRQSYAGWVRSVKESSPNEGEQQFNVAVTAVQQQSSIDTMRFPGFFTDYIYNFSGGNYRVQVTNHSNQTVQNLHLNTSFGANQFFIICFNFSARQKHFSGLNLAPGESVWLEFGDIAAGGQAEIPAEVCFWTSSPNGAPDAVRKDDRLCHPLQLTVDVNQPEPPAFSIAPVPADGFVDITANVTLSGLPWKLYDAAGRCVAHGIYPGESPTLRLETARLPGGFYIFQAGNRSGKLIVRH
jgi:hypothetical protein